MTIARKLCERTPHVSEGLLNGELRPGSPLYVEGGVRVFGDAIPGVADQPVEVGGVEQVGPATRPGAGPPGGEFGQEAGGVRVGGPT